jgi:hypothetical protein
MNRRWKRALKGLGIGAISLLGAVGLIAWMIWQSMLPALKEETYRGSVRAEMATLQLAVEDFGIASGGSYPIDEAGILRFSVLHKLLENPYTGEPTEPRVGHPPADAPPGSVWYEPVRGSTGKAVSYRITGFDRRGRLHAILVPDTTE